MAAEVATRSRVRRQRNVGQRWWRRLHMWTSMTSLLIVLFFSLTGITLNHPTWTFGQPPVTATARGTLPETAITNGGIDFLAISEYLRATQHVTGEVTDHSSQNGEGSISYRGPGYAADVQFQLADRSYSLTSQKSGVVAVFNDLHKGRHTSAAWKWIIDITAGLLVLMSVTGIALQLTLKRTRRLALVLGGLGSIVAVALVALSM